MRTREEFIDSLWTDERRDDAYKLWDELIANEGWIDLVREARRAQDAGNGEPWRMLVQHWASELHFTSDEDRWDSLCPMVAGGVAASLGLNFVGGADRTDRLREQPLPWQRRE